MADFDFRVGTVDVDDIVFGEKPIAVIVESNLARQPVEQDLFLDVPLYSQ